MKLTLFLLTSKSACLASEHVISYFVCSSLPLRMLSALCKHLFFSHERENLQNLHKTWKLVRTKWMEFLMFFLVYILSSNLNSFLVLLSFYLRQFLKMKHSYFGYSLIISKFSFLTISTFAWTLTNAISK